MPISEGLPQNSRIARNINFITIGNGSIELICRKKRTGRYDDSTAGKLIRLC